MLLLQIAELLTKSAKNTAANLAHVRLAYRELLSYQSCRYLIDDGPAENLPSLRFKLVSDLLQRPSNQLTELLVISRFKVRQLMPIRYLLKSHLRRTAANARWMPLATIIVFDLVRSDRPQPRAERPAAPLSLIATQ